MIDINSIKIEDIENNAVQIDAEILHLKLNDMIANKKADSYIDALLKYIDENDINIDKDVNSLISPSLRSIIYREALDGYMLKETPLKNCIEDFF